MIEYNIKSALCLAFLLVFYRLVLEREKMHHFNRFYLLGSILFSFLVPFYKIQTVVSQKAVFFLDPTTQENPLVDFNLLAVQTNYALYLTMLYFIVTSVFVIRFIKNITTITNRIRRHQKIKKGKAILVLVDDAINPHTFWKYIFINKKEYLDGTIENQLYTHELTHVLQKHTFDIILIELLHALFWINPTYLFLKKAIKLNHEFLADNNVITTYKNTTEYQYLLLNRATWNNEYYLASNLNYLLTKKRLLMMTKQSSQTKILLKKLTVMPLCIGFIALFAQRITAQENANNEIVLEYNKLANKYTEKPNTQIIKKKDIERLELLYGKLSSKQKNNAVAFPSIPAPPEATTNIYGEDGAKLFYVKNKDGITYYNGNGQKVTKKGAVLSTKQTKSNEVVPDQNTSEVYKGGKAVTTVKSEDNTNFPKVKKGDITNIPPPPRVKN